MNIENGKLESISLIQTAYPADLSVRLARSRDPDTLHSVTCKKCGEFLCIVIQGAKVFCRGCQVWTEAPGGHYWCSLHQERYLKTGSCARCNSERVRRFREKHRVGGSGHKLALRALEDKAFPGVTIC